METREETEARETKLVDDTKTFLQGLVKKINITNPLAGLDVLPTTEESLDPDSLKVYQDVNKPVEQLQSIAKEGLQTATGIYGAALGAYGTVANQPRNIINITPPNQTQIPKYSSGQVVQTSKGPLIRLDPGTLNYEKNVQTLQSTYNRMSPGQLPMFDINQYYGPIDPSSKAAALRFNEYIAKKSGYESMAKFKREVLNKWPEKDRDQLFRELWHNRLYEGYIEHLTAKGSHMDWYWNMKGKDRNAVENVRILYNDNLKNLKDTVEKIVYGTSRNPGLGWKGESLENRLIVSFEDPMRKTRRLFSRQNPGDIIIKRAGNDKIIGNLGQYLDVLYPQDPVSKDLFIRGVQSLGKKPSEFRKEILTERINIIIRDSYKLPSNNTQRKRFIKKHVDEDMIKLIEQYPFLQRPKAITEQIEATGSGMTEADLNKRSTKSKKKGPFPSKTEEIQQEWRPPGTPKSG